ncbi:MAG: LPS export ABC transporter permease LptF [Nitrospirota bacterium]
MKIIDKYIVREFMPPFLLGLLLFTFVLLINRIFKLTELIVNKGVPVTEVLKLISYLMPSFLTLTIPMAVLLAALVAFGRLSTDSEIIALKATGFSLFRMMAPVFAVSLLAMAATAYFSLYLGPLKAQSFKKDLFKLAQSRAYMGIEESVFNDSFKDVVIYAQKSLSANEMEGVFISDERNPNEPHVIIAKKGVMDMNMSSGYAYLNLYDGSIHNKENKSGSYQEINFDKNILSINLFEKLLPGDESKKSKREMTLEELRSVAREVSKTGNNYPLLTEYYKRFTIPLACIIFGIIGPPLGLFSRRSGRSTGISVALVVFALYYLLMKGGENMAAGGRMAPLMAALLPNLVIGAFGVWLVYNSSQEKKFSFSEISNTYERWKRTRGRRKRGETS